ncbi:interferon-induced, double-stranded RNA-activated kinase isoform X1 [Paramuricea clavata]|uniref:Interferon-induced, double-stranded RNA-activated kinase isoform X1 n=1 Tax=Paramuricea clavata TaxID=317549 RepID=A0A6S7JX32_PARCT|nr:interferon-induced, double-stranded RNA-activated kinase isoform X1 [Paramuricea clavata]
MDKVNEHVKIREALRGQREFDTEHILGEGNFGMVVRAKCTKEGEDNGKTFAIKIMKYDEYDKKSKECQNREIESLFRLNNSNVIKYFGSWVMQVGYELKLCIQMELCLVNLKTFVNKNEMGGPKIVQSPGPPRFYQQVFRQILNGLVAIHKMQWIHRDIHPGNILIANPNPHQISDIHVKIGDLGLARSTAVKIKIDTLPDGTVEPEVEKLTPFSWNGIHTAPELKEDTYDSKVDVYSAGEKYSTDADESMSTSQEKYSTDSSEASETVFFARKRNEEYLRMCFSNKFTFTALTAEVERRIRVRASRQILVQERMLNDEKRGIIIEDDKVVKYIFENATQKAKDVVLVVTEKAEEDSNIETGQISSENVSMESA